MNKSEIVEELVKVQGVKTSVLKLGRLREAESQGAPRHIMLIIPGNPGVSYYYEDFMHELFSHCEGQVPVWTIGHAGHVCPPGETMTLSDVVSTNEDLFGLEAQISHKVSFIREHIPEDVSIILIGHSIGCYMILNMLDELAPQKIIRCFMLFPTIERMAQSPNGLVFTPALRYIRWLIVLTTFFLCFLPGVVRASLFKWYFKKIDYPDCVLRGLLETVTPWTSNYATFLAKIEMNKVTTLQSDLVKKHLSKLSFYYGTIDDWAPSQYYHDLVAQFPEADARLCEFRLKHAFILKRSEGQAMASIVWEWAQSHHRLIKSGSTEEGDRWAFD